MQEYRISPEEMRESVQEKRRKNLKWWKVRWVETKMSAQSLKITIDQIKYLETLISQS
jgi:hypothetical protein